MASQGKPSFKPEELVRRTFDRAARVLREVWEEGWGHTRLLDAPFIRDDLVMAGVSKMGAECREHVVPLKVVYDECESMFQRGCPLEEVSAFLETHVKIVRISKEEKQKLDSRLGLKTKMPEGWEPRRDDVFQRLRVAGIEWNDTPGEPRHR
jgi:hypothetical protein